MLIPEPAILAFRRANYSTEQLGDLLGVSKRTVERIEAGNGASLAVVLAYFRALNVRLVQRVQGPKLDADYDATLEDVRGYR